MDQVLALAHTHGIPAVELRALAGSVDLPGYFSRIGKSPAALGAFARASKVRIASLSTSLSLIDGSDVDRRNFLEFVPWAEALGIPWLRVFDGGKTADEGELARAAATLDWWATLRAARGWKTDLMIETHDALANSRAIARFVRIGPAAAILWDSHHTWWKGGEDPVTTWKAIRKHVVHIHVKDSVHGDGPHQPCKYVLPGTGAFPMAALRAELAGQFKGPVSMEWEKLWHPELPPLEEALDSAATTSWW